MYTLPNAPTLADLEDDTGEEGNVLLTGRKRSLSHCFCSVRMMLGYSNSKGHSQVDGVFFVS